MGGGQSLNIGLVHPEVFAYVGGFSRRGHEESAQRSRARSVGSQAVEADLALFRQPGRPDPHRPRRARYLKENGVQHIWNVDGHAHGNPEWSANLYLFAQHIFR